MSDRMRPMEFSKLLEYVLGEYEHCGTIFGIRKNKIYRNNSNTHISLFGEKLSSPVGPAAGPNSQLAQNIVAAYLGGARFIELKTVQKIDGEDLPVEKPCILAQDEGYNVEWSTELRVHEAYEEYVKAWVILHALMKELEISEQRDFMFNMSVGYDLEGIKLPKINDYIDGMKDASNSFIWKQCIDVLCQNMRRFKKFNNKDITDISPVICRSITLSTLHGCPPDEIERITNYLLKDKKLNTYIKLNPTMLGEEFVRNTFDGMGYDYITLNSHHFNNDLQYDDGIKMLYRLKETAKELSLNVGVKLTNTLPTKIQNGELPGSEMYLSGRALYPLTINLAYRLAKEFEGDLLISYSGGADYFNIDKILNTGIQPITIATTILKPGGYERITQIAQKVERDLIDQVEGIDVDKLSALADEALTDSHHVKELRPVQCRKLDSKLPIYDCAIAPCTIGCPINQQIPEYVSLVGQQRYDEAIKVVTMDNALPAITASICDHKCQFKCTRLDYDESVAIRNIKKLAVLNAQDELIDSIKPSQIRSNKKACIIGAGPAGIATAYFLRRNGVSVTVLEKSDKPFGIVSHVIPGFRISNEMIDRDYKLALKHGALFEFGVNENYNLNEIKKEFDYIIIATGASRHVEVGLRSGEQMVVNAIDFLKACREEKQDKVKYNNVCIIGGGDVAMDAARAATRLPGNPEVSIIYRRTRKYMPAEIEEIELALSDGVKLVELLSPIEYDGSTLVCEVMELGEKGNDGRRNTVFTGRRVSIDADLVIGAIGERVNGQEYKVRGIDVDEKLLPKLNEWNETNLKNIYIAGDGRKGPSTVVKAIKDAKNITLNILDKEGLEPDFVKFDSQTNEPALYYKKGVLSDQYYNDMEGVRCLSCNSICELCVDVCPNRANVMIRVYGDFDSTHQIIHLDGMCNECGNCGTFCPHNGNPYKDKITIFWNEVDFDSSTNLGFYVVDKDKGNVIVRTSQGQKIKCNLYGDNCVDDKFKTIIKTCIEDYQYML